MTTVPAPTRRARKHAAPRRAETLTTDWTNQSACYNRPEQWWDGDDKTLTSRARTVCLSCPVLANCLGEQMRLEAANLWSRSSVRGGLTGPERIQLCIDENTDGPYDAEEARLLALEAGAYGQPVAEIAEAGLSVSTVRLAARLAGEEVPDRAPVKAAKGTALERAFENAEEIMAWREAGVSRRQIGARLGLGRAAVDAVIRTYRALTGEKEVEKPTVSDAERVLINDYLDGKSVLLLTQEQQLAAVVEGNKRGMTYLDIDRIRGCSLGSTAQFVSRLRKKYEKEGRDFPVITPPARRKPLSDELVLELREAYAAGGVTDLDLALKYEVSRKTVSDVISGRNYQHVGGPIRRGRTAAAKQASKDGIDAVCRVAFAASRAKKNAKDMEEAA